MVIGAGVAGSDLGHRADPRTGSAEFRTRSLDRFGISLAIIGLGFRPGLCLFSVFHFPFLQHFKEFA